MIKKILIVILAISILFVIISNVYSMVLRYMYPNKYSEYVYSYSEKYNVDSNWIFALIKAESNFEPESISQSRSCGAYASYGVNGC